METEKCISILQDVIKIKSENDQERLVAEYYKRLLNSYGIDAKLVEYSEDRYNLVAEIENGSGKTLALSGHMDVVNAGDEKEWTYPPFSGHIEDGVIWGRGTSDMKSGLTALVIAMIDLHESKAFNGKIRLLATVGEEIGELGSQQLTNEGYVDGVDAMIIGEPCSLAIMYAHKGSLNYKVISRGTSAHSSTPEMGNNAIHNIIYLIDEINKELAQKINLYKNDVMGQVLHNITLISGGNQINSIPDYAEFQANARTIPEFDNDDLIACVKEVIDRFNKDEKYNLELIVTSNQPPVESDPRSRLISVISEVVNKTEELNPKKLLSSMEDMLGEDFSGLRKLLDNYNGIPVIASSGTTDAAQFMRANKNLELAVYGPGVPVLNHKINERIPLSQYLGFIDGYKKIVEKYLS